jgi:hypothetical protein
MKSTTYNFGQNHNPFMYRFGGTRHRVGGIRHLFDEIRRRFDEKRRLSGETRHRVDEKRRLSGETRRRVDEKRHLSGGTRHRFDGINPLLSTNLQLNTNEKNKKSCMHKAPYRKPTRNSCRKPPPLTIYAA